MPLTITFGPHRLDLRVTCFGARGAAEPTDEDTWRVDANEGVAIFLLGDDAEDGSFLARVAHGGEWETDFYDERWHQLALRDPSGDVNLLLKLEPAGAPIPAGQTFGGGGEALEVAAGPALWLTIRAAGAE